MKNNLKFCAALFFTMTSTLSYAIEPGGYITASLGQTTLESADIDDKSTAYKIGGGYAYNGHFALEGYIIDHGTAQAELDSDNDSNTPKIKTDIESSAFVIQAVGVLPFAKVFDLYGKIGLSLWSTDYIVKNSREATREQDTDLIYGIAGAFNITSYVAVRLEWESSQYDAIEASTWSAGVSFHFH